MLSSAQIAFYQNQGYLLIPRMFDAQRVAMLRELIDTQLAHAIAPTTRGKNDLVDMGTNGTPKAVYRLSRVMERDPQFAAVAQDARMQEVACSLLGPDAAVCINRHNMMVAKAPRVGRAIEWHQDGATWGHDELLAVIVFLRDASPVNGCLEIIPGLHRHGLLPSVEENGFVKMNMANAEMSQLGQQALPVVASEGDALFFHALLPHSSKENTSEYARPTLTFAFVNESSKTLKFKTGMEPIQTMQFAVT